MNSLRILLTRARYFGPAWVFASLNVIISTWILYIPTVKERLDLDKGDLGQALFCFSLGMFLIIPFAPRLLRSTGLGRGTFLAVVATGLAMIAPVLVPTYPLLCAALFLGGVFVSLTDIGMNALVSGIETADEAHFLSAAHGFFSLGGVLGAGIGSLFIGAFLPWTHAAGAAIFVLLTNLIFVRHYWKYREANANPDDEEKRGMNWSLVVTLLPLVVLSLLTMGSEGSVEHWSKLYLLELGGSVSERAAGFGFVAFSATMTLGRFLGDAISQRFGSRTLVRGGNLLAAAGYGLVLVGDYGVSLAGFALVGLGFSVIIPELFRLAGRTRGVDPSESIAVVAGLGYVGFLLSPALLGYLADWGGLRLSFAVLAGAALVGVVVQLGTSGAGNSGG